MAWPERSGTTMTSLSPASRSTGRRSSVSSNRAPTATACPSATARSRTAAGRRRDVEQAGVVDPGGEQHLGVAALRGQPERGVLGVHQGADPAEQHVGQAAVGAVLADRPGSGRRRRRASGAGGRTPRTTGRPGPARSTSTASSDDRPRRGVERDQEDQADRDVDGRGDQHRAARR